MEEIQTLSNLNNPILNMLLMITLAILPIKLIILIYQDVPVTTVSDTKHWKKLLQNVVRLRLVVVLLGVVGVLQKETIWLISVINSELDRKYKETHLLKKFLGF